MSQARPHHSWIGHTIGGRYKIESLLGQGGMSSVYKATDPNLRRTVAVKLIHPHLSSDPEFVRRFEQEAAAVAQLRHQHIIQVFDFNHEENVYYMVLEYVAGETLQDRLNGLNKTDQLLPTKKAVDITAKLCDAVAYAHEKGMIHRDLKPANVMINASEQPILMDFGVAKMLDAAKHTATGAIIGTAKYMSPEQARGDRPDERTDIYSLGVMLYEMVTGVTPFEGESTVAILMKHVTETLPDIREIKSDLSPDLAAVIEKSLAKDRNERHQTAANMAVALRAANLTAKPTPAAKPPVAAPPDSPDATILHAPVSAAPPAKTAAPKPTPPPAIAPAPAPSSGFPMWIIGAGVVGVVLILGIVGAIFAFSGSGGDETPAAQNGDSNTVVAVGETDAPTDTPAPSPTPEPTKPETATATPEATATAAPATATQAASNGAVDNGASTDEETSDNGEASDSLSAQPQETDTPTPTPEPEPTDTPAPTNTPTPPSRQGMTFVPSGFFLMGSSTGEAIEQPEHPVLLNGFFIDTTEVTNAEYRQCVTDGACTPANTADSFTQAGYRDAPAFNDYPVISVTWDQANTYCRWADKRLPTEAEWEYAASGPENFIWPWGNNFNAALSAASTTDTQPVDSFSNGASPFGVLNMAGNVNEWVADTFSQEFYANSSASNPLASGSGDGRVYRGGSFDNTVGDFYTTSRRYGNVRSFSEVDVGFRCAADAPNAAPSDELAAEFCDIYAGFKPGATCP